MPKISISGNDYKIANAVAEIIDAQDNTIAMQRSQLELYEKLIKEIVKWWFLLPEEFRKTINNIGID